MSNAVESYTTLMQLAATGRDFTLGEIRVLDPDDTSATLFFGTGFDFSTSLQVPDITDGQTVEAIAQLRVIRTDMDTLYLRTRLDWTTFEGDKHESHAVYNLTPEAAHQLANQEPSATFDSATFDENTLCTMSPAELINLVTEAVFDNEDRASQFEARWHQVFPGSDGSVDDLEILGRHTHYHERVIMGLHEQGEQIICMLSDMDLGSVDPTELDTLLAWITTRPSLTTTS